MCTGELLYDITAACIHRKHDQCGDWTATVTCGFLACVQVREALSLVPKQPDAVALKKEIHSKLVML
jgi:hypothetical protein